MSAIIISDVHPGVGVIHTQAYYYAANQNYGRTLMNLGTLTPQQIIDSLKQNDNQHDSTKRQYGIVDMVHNKTAQWTGSNCDNYKNHIHGSYYSVQGNTMLGQQILDSIESRFLNTSGNLACRLMAALQGAKVVGADTRCASYGISTFSAFIRVANPTDVAGSFYLDLTVNTYPNHIDPIDSLQTKFDLWGGCLSSYVTSSPEKNGVKIFPNPASNKLAISSGQLAIKSIDIYSSFGQKVLAVLLPTADCQLPTEVDVSALPSGIYFMKIETSTGEIISAKLVKL